MGEMDQLGGQLKYNTTTLAQGRFRAHGHIEAVPDGNLLRHQAWGPFNDELVAAFAALQDQLLPQMQAAGRWGDLVIFHRSALAPPATFDAYAAYMHQRARLGQAASVTALVMPPEVEGGEIMTALFVKLYQQVGLVLHTFVDVAAAECWIRAQLEPGGGCAKE
jgi:hypothetical protein